MRSLGLEDCVMVTSPTGREAGLGLGDRLGCTALGVSTSLWDITGSPYLFFRMQQEMGKAKVWEAKLVF